MSHPANVGTSDQGHVDQGHVDHAAASSEHRLRVVALPGHYGVDEQDQDPGPDGQDADEHDVDGQGVDGQGNLDEDDLDEDDSDWGHDDAPYDQQQSAAAFPGDEGTLETAQRELLVLLLKKRFISARHHRAAWRVLTADPGIIRSRLNDLFLDLHIDHDREVAFKRQVAPESGTQNFPTLLHDTAWGREETIVLVHLRQQGMRQADAGQDRALVDRDDLLAYVATYRPPTATDHAGDAKKASNAIDNIVKTGLLSKTATPDRYEISNAIDVLLPVDKLTNLLAWLRQQNGTDHADPADPAGPDRLPTHASTAPGDDPTAPDPAEDDP